jgi:hypothetical protein
LDFFNFKSTEQFYFRATNPHLSAADLVNVWAYTDAHTDEIEEAIRKNDEAMQEDEAISVEEALRGKLIRVTRPAR